MRALVDDLRFALRLMLKNTRLSLVAVTCIALGIGPSAALFTLVNGLLIRPVDAEDPHRLVAVNSLSTLEKAPEPSPSLTYPDLETLSATVSSFAEVVGVSTATVVLQADGPARRVSVQTVTSNYFDAIGRTAALGDTFHPQPVEAPGRHPEMVLSHRLWRELLGGDRSVVGREVTVNGFPFTVVGVMGRDFFGPVVFEADAWAPITMTPQLRPGEGERLEQHNHRWVQSFARLADGVTAAEADEELEQVALRLEEDHPKSHQGRRFTVSEFNTFGGMSPPSGLKTVLLAVAVVFVAVLFLACSSVAALLLSRATARRHEIATRIAVGATRARLVRQLLTESFVLTAVGGVAGLILGLWILELFQLAVTSQGLPVVIPATVDWRVLLVTAGLVVVATVLAGLAPAFQGTRGAALPALKDQPGGLGTGVGVTLWRRALIVIQFALATALLVVAAVFVADLGRARQLDPGFEPEQLVIYPLQPSLYGFLGDRQVELVETMQDLLEDLGAVDRVAVSRLGPFAQHRTTTRVTVLTEDLATGPEVRTAYNYVGPGFLEVMEIPLVAGRSFERHAGVDRQPECVVNRHLAEEHFAGDAVGHHLAWGSRILEIVGVAENASYYTLGEEPQPYVYVPMARMFGHEVAITAGVRGDPERALDEVAAAIRGRYPQLVVDQLVTVQEALSRVLGPARLLAVTFAALGLLALVLGLVGASGLVALSVTQRAFEVGVRLAIGGTPPELARMLVATGLRPVVLGVILGTGAIALLSPGLTSLLSADRISWFAVVAPPVALLALAAVALAVPAFRTVRREPMRALRYE